MGLSVLKLLLIVLIVLLVFGAGKLPKVMADLGKGLRSFREGLQDGDSERPERKKPAEIDEEK